MDLESYRILNLASEPELGATLTFADSSWDICNEMMMKIAAFLISTTRLGEVNFNIFILGLIT